MITEMTYEQLKSVYVKEGITGLRNYQFLVPIYITDTGDIFGMMILLEGFLKIHISLF